MRSKTAKEIIKTASPDYMPDRSIFTTDGERVARLKQALTRLSQADRTIVILYSETASLRAVAKMLNVSHTTIRTELQRIRSELFKIMNIKL